MVNKINILSVDWDYFFPHDTFCLFDWAANDENEILKEIVWSIRASEINIKRQKSIEYVIPNENKFNGFWDKVCHNNPLNLYICDSHLELYKIVEKLSKRHKNINVYNFDAHHDLYVSTNLNCGNWVYYALKNNYISEYNLISSDKILYYEFDINKFPNFKDRIKTSSIIETINDVYLIFICRSSPWTPTWSDDKWLKFIGYWKERDKKLWKNRQTINKKFIENIRHPNMKEAIELFEKYEIIKQNFKKGIYI